LHIPHPHGRDGIDQYRNGTNRKDALGSPARDERDSLSTHQSSNERKAGFHRLPFLFLETGDSRTQPYPLAVRILGCTFYRSFSTKSIS